MAKTSFDDLYTAVATTAASASSFNSMQLGIQQEFEDRFGDALFAGVVSGLEPTVSTTSIAVAAGRGYGLGKRYEGGDSITFVAAGAGTYYVYWDASAEALAKGLTAPDHDDDIGLCMVTWNGTTTLSALVDLRVWGCVPLQLWAVTANGGATVTTGRKFTIPVLVDCWIDFVQVVQSDNGSGSSTIVDVHVGNSGSAPTTIFTTTANRPSVGNAVADWTVTTSGVPDGTRKLTAGQVLTIEVDQVATNAQDLGVAVYGRLYM